MKELVEIDHARFNPEDPADVARVMESVLSSEDLGQELVDYGLRRSRQFTWKRVAQATAECYRAVAPPEVQRRSCAPARRRLVAFCTPFPPEQSGVADYSKRFLETLVTHHPLRADIVVKGEPESYVPLDHPAMDLISVPQFRWLAEHGHYDSIIYCMGNSAFHDYVYELLKEHRGTVWLHDVRLTGFYHWYYLQLGRDPTTLPEELLPWARRYPDYENALIVRDIITQHRQGIYLAGEVASYAQKIVVNSRFSKELVEIESGGRAPVVAVPHAALSAEEVSLRESWPQLAAKYGLDQRATVLVSVGIIGPAKCPEYVIDGFVAANPAANNLVLVFVGAFAAGCESWYKPDLERRISERGIEDRVRFAGHVEEAELDSWLAAARCAIQLRFPTNGESSGAVMRSLAAGLPTIVTDHGPLRELPDDAVIKVPAPVEPSALREAILQLLSDDNARKRLHRGALHYAQRVSFEAVADQFWTEVLCPSSR
jgi:glycosyltransferase involved in cell wall biosynthesis